MKPEDEILALEDKRCAAMTAAEADALAAMLHDDLLYTHSSAVVDVNGVRKSLRLRYLDAWTRTPQGWKFIAWQSTGIPAR